jgi:hypothetical protein
LSEKGTYYESRLSFDSCRADVLANRLDGMSRHHALLEFLSWVLSELSAILLEARTAYQASGSRLTFESRRGFPADWTHASLAHCEPE